MHYPVYPVLTVTGRVGNGALLSRRGTSQRSSSRHLALPVGRRGKCIAIVAWVSAACDVASAVVSAISNVTVLSLQGMFVSDYDGRSFSYTDIRYHMA